MKFTVADPVGSVKKIDAALATSNVADLASLDATVAALA